MRLLAALALCSATLTSLEAQPAMTPPPSPPPEIVVSATSSVRVTPDRARIAIGVQTEAPTAAAAGTTNARLTTAVRDALLKLGVAATDIGTINYSVQPQQRWDPRTNKASITGYRVANTVTVTLKELDLAGRAIDVALGAGANVIEQLEFYAASTDAPRREALAKAVAAARADADAMATAAGMQITGLLSAAYSSEPVGPRPMLQKVEMMAMRADAAPETPVSVGEQLLAVTVQTRWAVAPKP
jgi:uncharacterized protein YggE